MDKYIEAYVKNLHLNESLNEADESQEGLDQLAAPEAKDHERTRGNTTQRVQAQLKAITGLPKLERCIRAFAENAGVGSAYFATDPSDFRGHPLESDIVRIHELLGKLWRAQAKEEEEAKRNRDGEFMSSATLSKLIKAIAAQFAGSQIVGKTIRIKGSGSGVRKDYHMIFRPSRVVTGWEMRVAVYSEIYKPYMIAGSATLEPSKTFEANVQEAVKVIKWVLGRSDRFLAQGMYGDDPFTFGYSDKPNEALVEEKISQEAYDEWKDDYSYRVESKLRELGLDPWTMTEDDVFYIFTDTEISSAPVLIAMVLRTDDGKIRIEGEDWWNDTKDCSTPKEVESELDKRYKKFVGMNESMRKKLNEASSTELKRLMQEFGEDPAGMSTDQMEQRLAQLYWEKDHPVEPMPTQVAPQLYHEISDMSPEELRKRFNKGNAILQRKCFHDRATIQMADGTQKYANRVKVGDRVRGYDNGRVVEAVVTAVERQPSTREWYNLGVRAKGGLTVTADHKIFTQRGEVRAEDLQADDLVQMLVRKPTQLGAQLAVGACLGDGNVLFNGNSASFRIAHSVKQRDYLFLKRKFLGSNLPVRDYKAKCGNQLFDSCMFETGYTPDMMGLLSRCCSFEIRRDGRQQCAVRKLSDWVIDNLDWPVLAYWYGDDGSIHRAGTVHPNMRLNLKGFPVDRVKLLQKALEEKLGLKSSYHSDNNLGFDWQSSERLSKEIEKYLSSDLDYKLINPGTRDPLVPELWTEECETVFVPLTTYHKTVRNQATSPIAITVYPGHTLFAGTQGMLVSNSDGLNMVFYVSPSGTRATSRSRSVKNFQFGNFIDHLPAFQNIKCPWQNETIFNGEIQFKPGVQIKKETPKTSLQAIMSLLHTDVETATRVQQEHGSAFYEVFDIIKFNGEDVSQMPFEQRYDIYNLAVKELQEANPNLPISGIETWDDYDDIWDIIQTAKERKYEGVLIKLRNSLYRQGYRSHDMVKYKFSQTFDGFITGAVESDKTKSRAHLIGGFIISAYVGGTPKVVASISGIPVKTLEEATVQDEFGNPQLNPSFLNRCLAFTGQQWSKNGLMEHARLAEWRPDKTPQECTIDPDVMRPDREG